MRQLYTKEGISQLRAKARKAAILSVAAGGIALAVCVMLCFGIRTRNAAARQIAVIAVSALGAGAVIALLEGIRLPALREAAHEEGVLREETVVHEGILTEIGAAHPIPRSITFCPVTLREGDQEVSLKLNAAWAGEAPKTGEHLLVETHRGYITGWSGTEEKAKPDVKRGETAGKPALRFPLARVLRHALGGLLAGALLWSWIFTFLTDTDASHKIMIYADMHSFQDKALAIALEEAAPEGIRFVQAHPFSFALMDSSALERADLYIMTRAQAAEYADWVGEQEGILLYDVENRAGAAMSFLNYGEQPEENWYLYYGAQSPHAGLEDTAAETIADELLRLP